MVAISGYSGLIGSALEKKLQEKGIVVVRLSRNELYDGEGGLLQKKLSGCGAVIHLAGAPVLQRWTEKNRKIISESRVVTTANLVNAVNKLPEMERPRLFMSASAVGIYRNGVIHTEESSDFDDHFAAQVTADWEKSSSGLQGDIRRVIFRTGLVLDINSQIIKRLWFPFIAGFGGVIGSGRQPFPFIHLHDLTEAMVSAIENPGFSGIYNLVAPDRKDNRQFSEALAKKMNRPCWFTIPGFSLRLIFGKASVMLLESPEVIPGHLVREGFIFRYATLESALDEIVKHKKGCRFRQPHS